MNSRVLVVEDEYFLADDMVRCLTAAGMRVVGPVSNVRDALDLLSHTSGLDAAILDVNLNGDAVYPVARALGLRRIPFVFATGYDVSTIPPEFAHVSLFSKPLEAKCVVSQLGKLLGAWVDRPPAH